MSVFLTNFSVTAVLQISALQISNYFSHRRLLIVHEHSSFYLVSTSVPQRFVLAPTLFILKIHNYLFNFHSNADDSIIHTNFQLSKPYSNLVLNNNCRTISTDLSTDFETILNWDQKNLVQFNISNKIHCPTKYPKMFISWSRMVWT